MKNILVPIDFSQCSMDAFLYAKGLAEALGFSIKLVHIYSGNLNIDHSINLHSEKNREETILNMMNEFVKVNLGNSKNSNVLTRQKIETEAIVGLNTTQQIITLTSNENDIAMVVIGTTGTGNVLDRMFGSISSGVAQRSHCPVILVPQGTEYKDFKDVLYASNYESADEHLVDQIIDFGNVFRATMHFVHVEENDNYENVEDTIFYKLFEKGDPAFSFNLVNIKNCSVLEGLNQYADENEVDLIVLVNRQRNYLENIFQLSLTKKMAKASKLPVMVFHLLND
ncbi:MAG: nucleotide-binding universal stress UspA family protein [Granulosicoccus sp.]|jgi:nucleotide-binding universal stress UspA family protein